MTAPNPDRTESGEADVWYVVISSKFGMPVYVSDSRESVVAMLDFKPDPDIQIIPVVPLSRAERAEAECRAMRAGFSAIVNNCNALRGMFPVSFLDSIDQAEALLRSTGTAGAALLDEVKRMKEALNAVVYFWRNDPEAFGDKATPTSMAGKFHAVGRQCELALDPNN